MPSVCHLELEPHLSVAASAKEDEPSVLLEEAADETPEVVLDVTSPGRRPDGEGVRSCDLEVVNLKWKFRP